MKQQRPLGVTILGALNFYLFGILALVACIILYRALTPENWQAVSQQIKNVTADISLTRQQIKSALLMQMLLAAIFIITGRGILKKREWARKTVLAFAFSMVAITFISTIAQPALIQQAILQIIYPGILIIYFTNKNVERYFKSQDHQEERL